MFIYVDSDYQCHSENDGTMREVETDFFDNKCNEFIEGYIYDDSNGVCIYPWKPYEELEKAQVIYEHELLEELRKVYAND